MTHTYSRGCFKLIFRKCHPVHPLPYAHTYSTYSRSLSRSSPLSRTSAPSNDTATSASATAPFSSASRLGYPPLPSLRRSLRLPSASFFHSFSCQSPPPAGSLCLPHYLLSYSNISRFITFLLCPPLFFLFFFFSIFILDCFFTFVPPNSATSFKTYIPANFYSHSFVSS